MGWLDDYNPIANLSVAGTDVSNPSGVIVIVGPNSSGKTLLLEDIEHYFTTGELSKIVCSGLTPHHPGQPQAIWEDLESRHYIRRIGPQPDAYTTYLSFLCGDKQPRQSRRKGRGENPQFNRKMFEEVVASVSKAPEKNQFFQFVGSTLTGYLSLDVRRQICSATQSFNHAATIPTLPLQGLQLNSTAQETLAEETGRVFANAVWLDISSHNQYQLRVSGKPTRPPVGDMINPLRAGDYFSIEQEGDGFQSYVGICISILLGIRPVLLIDEPELCLHPPQAYNIGRFIGQHALTKHATFVSTHSSYVLRGILETAKKVTVIRLTNRNRVFAARLLPNEELRVAVRNPRSRAEAVLDGLFAKAVIVVESDGDREVYQAAGENIAGFPSQEGCNRPDPANSRVIPVLAW